MDYFDASLNVLGNLGILGYASIVGSALVWAIHSTQQRERVNQMLANARNEVKQ